MAFALVQEAVKLQSTAALTTTITIPATTAGNCLVLCLETAAGTGASWTSIVDDGSNTWSLVGNGGVSGAVATHTAMYVCANAASVTSVTANLAGATNRVMTVSLSEWSGVVSASAVEAGGFRAHTPAATPVTTATITTSVACLLVANTGQNLGAAPAGNAVVPDAGWTALTAPAAAANSGQRIMYRVQSGPETSFVGSWTLNAARVAGTNIVALKGTGGSVFSGAADLDAESSLTAAAVAKFSGSAALDAAGSLLASGHVLAASGLYVHHLTPLGVSGAQITEMFVQAAVANGIPAAHAAAVLAGNMSSGIVPEFRSSGVILGFEDEMVGGFEADGTLI